MGSGHQLTSEPRRRRSTVRRKEGTGGDATLRPASTAPPSPRQRGTGERDTRGVAVARSLR
eukprot:202650-Heterocapsa_arctica.AAC.1